MNSERFLLRMFSTLSHMNSVEVLLPMHKCSCILDSYVLKAIFHIFYPIGTGWCEGYGANLGGSA
jgi:hypothetical protein